MTTEIQIISGNILDYYNTHYIAHQCNCVSKYAKGIAKAIFDKFPATNVYDHNYDNKKNLGNIIIKDKIINMFAQYYPGENKIKENREHYFEQCLQKISELLPQNSNIAFPYNIGCGLAGGNWDNYYKMINLFANNNPTCNVVIIKLNEN